MLQQIKDTFIGMWYVMLQNLCNIRCNFYVSLTNCKSRILHLMVDVSSTIEEGRAVWLEHEKTMQGQLQPNKARSNKRSAAAAKCQAMSLDDNGTQTCHKSRVGLNSAARFHEQLVGLSPKRLNMDVKSLCACVWWDCGCIKNNHDSSSEGIKLQSFNVFINTL